MNELQPVVTRYIDAYNAKDVDAMLACLAPEVHFVNRSNGAVTAEARGHEAFRALAETGVELFLERAQEIEEFIAADTLAALRIRYRAIVARDLPNGWHAGQVIEIEGTSFFRIEADLIAELVDIA